jgi:hypothetical protein
MDELTALREFGIALDPGSASARAVARAALDRRLARRPRWFHRPAAVAVVAIVAVIVAGGAFALTRYVIVGSPAPQDVQSQEALISGVKATLRSHASTTGVLVDQTKAAAVVSTDSGPVYLWVAPTRDGGDCQYLDITAAKQPDGNPNLEGGCTSSSGHPFAIDASFPWTRLPDGKGLALVYGYAEDPATKIQIHFQSGATKTADMNGRYFMVEVPAGDSPGLADQVISLDAVASDGSVIATETKGQIAPPAHP